MHLRPSISTTPLHATQGGYDKAECKCLAHAQPVGWTICRTALEVQHPAGVVLVQRVWGPTCSQLRTLHGSNTLMLCCAASAGTALAHTQPSMHVAREHGQRCCSSADVCAREYVPWLRHPPCQRHPSTPASCCLYSHTMIMYTCRWSTHLCYLLAQ